MDKKISVLLAFLVIMALSGCLAGSYTFTADKPMVDEETQDSTGFQLQNTTTIVENFSADLRFQTVNVSVTIYQQQYARNTTMSIADTGGFSDSQAIVASIPQVEIAGQQINPMDKIEHDALIRENLNDNIHNITVEKETTETHPQYGEYNYTQFSAEVTQERIPVIIHFATIETQQNVLIVGVLHHESQDYERAAKMLFDGTTVEEN